MSEVLDNKVTIAVMEKLKYSSNHLGLGEEKCVIVHSKVIDLLNDWGYGLFNKDVILRKDGILSIKDTTKWTSIYEYYMGFEDEDYENEFALGVKGENGNFITKSEVRSGMIDYGTFNKVQFLNLFTDDESILNNEKKKHLYTYLFRDNKNEVFTFFDNGVIRTTKDGSAKVNYSTIKDGYIWDTKIRTELKNIELTDEKGLFEEFVEKCMSVKNENGEWEIDEKEYRHLEQFTDTYLTTLIMVKHLHQYL